MNIEDAAHTLAEWLHRIRDAGRPCPTNIAQSAVAALKCSVGMAREVRAHLVRTGRLVIDNRRNVYILDGNYFDPRVQDLDEAAQIKTILRRRHNPVIDPRTIADPKHVAKGEPKTLIIGVRIVPYARAREMAQEIAAP